MKTWLIVLIVATLVMMVVCVALYFLVKKQEKKQAERQAQMKTIEQQVSMLIIDKKIMRIKDAGFPAVVLENTPKYLRRTKVPVVKAKIGPQVTNFMCDEKVFPLLPVKKEVKATISGIYITGAKGIRGPLVAPEKTKKGFFARFKK